MGCISQKVCTGQYLRISGEPVVNRPAAVNAGCDRGVRRGFSDRCMASSWYLCQPRRMFIVSLPLSSYTRLDRWRAWSTDPSHKVVNNLSLFSLPPSCSVCPIPSSSRHNPLQLLYVTQLATVHWQCSKDRFHM